MQSSKVRSRLKAQLTKFTLELSEGLSKPLRAFVGEMLFGIQASQDVKLSNIARSLQEEIPLIKTEDRLSRNLQAQELESHLSGRLVELGSRRVEANTVLCLDLSDVRKEYAKEMEYLDEVWDGSEGEVHAGYWLLSVTAAGVEGSEITPLYQKLFSARAQDFVSENAEILAGVDRLRAHTGRAWDLDDQPGRGPQEAVGAAAGAAPTLCHSLHRPAGGDQSAPAEGHGSRPGRPLSPALSGACDPDRRRPGESFGTALRRRTDAPAGAGREVAAGGDRGLGARANAAADQSGGSAGLLNPVVDRANLSYPLEN